MAGELDVAYSSRGRAQCQGRFLASRICIARRLVRGVRCCAVLAGDVTSEESQSIRVMGPDPPRWYGGIL
jgi:hypothetical protein